MLDRSLEPSVLEEAGPTIAYLPGGRPYARDPESVDMLLDKLPICIARKDPKGRISWVNQMFCQLARKSREEILAVKNSDRLLYGPDLAELYKKSDRYVLQTGKPHTATEEHRFGDGEVRDVTVIKLPLFVEGGTDIVGVEVYFWDLRTLAEPMRTQERLKRLEELLNSPSTAIFEHDLSGNYRLSDAALDIVGRRGTKEWSGLSSTKLIPSDRIIAPEYAEIVSREIRNLVHSANPAEATSTYDAAFLGNQDERIPVEITSRLMLQAGEPIGVIGYARDLRPEQAGERRLVEVHHRVKNNLQTINAVLDRERRATGSSEAATSLRDCQTRVVAIADLHELLYREKRVDHIVVGDYVRNLVRKLVSTYSHDGQQVSARVNADSGLRMSLDAMVPCALVMQELVSNAFKHAFPDTRGRGNLFVSFTQTVERQIQIQVTDTGVGLPVGFDPRRAESLGLRLVFGLIEEQLRGRVDFGSKQGGTYFSATFRDPSPPPDPKRE